MRIYMLGLLLAAKQLLIALSMLLLAMVIPGLVVGGTLVLVAHFFSTVTKMIGG